MPNLVQIYFYQPLFKNKKISKSKIILQSPNHQLDNSLLQKKQHAILLTVVGGVAQW